MADSGAGRAVPLGSVAAYLAASLLAGCTTSKPESTDPRKPATPEAAAVGPAKELPPVSGRWQGLRGSCPTLDSAAAKALGATGQGRPTPEYTANGLMQQAHCVWGAAAKPSVNAQVSIFPVQESADTAWMAVSAKPSQQQISGLGDQAFSTQEAADTVAVHVRSKNSVVVVRVTRPGKATSASARQIAADVLNDLH